MLEKNVGDNVSSTVPLQWSTYDIFNRPIHLKQSTFNDHIMDENQRREFLGEENTLKSIIESPRFICQDKEYSTREHYIDMCDLPELSGVYGVTIIVDHQYSPGDVVTAFAFKNIKKQINSTGGIIYDSRKTDERSSSPV